MDNTTPRRRGTRKSLGQHFLVDGAYLNRIIKASDLSQNDLVVEIGPGQGALTSRLLEMAGQVICVEIDEYLSAGLMDRLYNPSNLTVINADARFIDIETVTSNRPYKLVANLPYYAANPIVRKFLEADNRPTRMIVMVQREVARSMLAKPGKMNILSVATQCYATPKLVCNVPPKAFRPAPSIMSSVVSLTLRDNPLVTKVSRQSFFDVVRAGFSAPRKQLRNSLSHGLNVVPDQALALLDAAHIDWRRRAETVTLEEWVDLHRVYADAM